MKSKSNISSATKILWSLLLAFILTGASVVESYALHHLKKEQSEDLQAREDSRETERIEDAEAKDLNSFEKLLGGGDGGSPLSDIDEVSSFYVATLQLLPNLFCLCYSYYPHINTSVESQPIETSFFSPVSFPILYHRLVFYEPAA